MSRRLDFNAIGFVGDSDVGKTTLLEGLIPVLAERGFAVASVKHASHGFDADRPGKDSHRLYSSGAQSVALIGDDQIATFARRDASQPVALHEALATLPPRLDVVLVEGFAWEPIPRIVLVAPGREPRPAHVTAGPVLRIVVVPEAAPAAKPVFADELVHEIAAEIAVWLHHRPVASPGKSAAHALWRPAVLDRRQHHAAPRGR